MTPAHTLLDQSDRDVIATDLDSTLIVEAAAGTGKTTELVRRILRILAAGKTTIGKIVAVTFTEKAAGELKLRLREALERERASAEGEARDRLDSALTKLEEAHVSTIHGFCADLLRERPVEACVDPLFTVFTEAQAQRAFGEAFGGWLQEQLADPPDGLRRALRRSAGWAFGRGTAALSQEGPVDRLRQAAWDLAEWRDFSAPWTRQPFDRDGEIDRLLRTLHELADLTASPSYARDNLFVDTAPARHLSQEIRLQQSIDKPDYDGWEARLVDLSKNRVFSNARRGKGPGYGKGVTRAVVTAALDQFRAELDQFRMAADADLAALLQAELAGASDRYEQLKRRNGALDFLDLLLKARHLMKTSAVLRRSFQKRFTHIFVDEFQDTDPLQAEILLLLTAADPEVSDWRIAVPRPGSLFIVGDPKQSIYRFRRADVGVYRDVCRRLEAAGAKPLRLTASFRSVPGIQSCINTGFAPVMTGDETTLQADYVRLSAFRPALVSQPAVVALPVPEPYGQRQLSMIAIERSLPDAVGAFIEWLVTRSNWKVTERRGAEPERVQARHVCILFRRFLSFGQDMTEPYVRSLEARGLPHVLVGGKTFHDREEVESLRAALAAVEWPDDELSVFATLRGALFSISDEDLLEWKHVWRLPFHPFRHARAAAAGQVPAHLLPIAEALDLLRRLHKRRNYVPIADTIQALLNATRAHVGFVLRSGGEQALANVLHVTELARQYEMEGGISFRGFVDELRAAAEGTQAPEAPILEEGSDGVRLMTVHKAKGLEFPIVILADSTCRMSRMDAGRWLDPDRGLCALKLAGLSPIDLLLHGAEELAREQAEGARLAYVAATRARDVLVVPVLGDSAYEGGWLDPLMPAVYPPEPLRRRSARAPGCPDFPSKDSVLTRPDGDPARSTTVAPGLHVFGDRGSTASARTNQARFGAASPDLVADDSPTNEGGRAPAPDTYSVVWWDPHVLTLGVESSFGLRRDDLIVKDGDMFAVEENLAAYERWRADRRAGVEAGSRRSMTVETATAWARTAAREADAALHLPDDDREHPIEIVAIDAAANRPFGPRFGTLVHAALATVPLDADADTIGRMTSTQARILATTAEEQVAAVRAVTAVLAHPVLDRARSALTSGRCYREMPITWKAPDRAIVEGTIDLAFEDDEGLTVLDFKTDRELATDLDRYRRQLTVYCRALAVLRGRKPRGILLRV
jgi:ATP-dependent helicase/nuclease subunit A